MAESFRTDRPVQEEVLTLTSKEVENRVVELLAAGKQWEADDLLDTTFGRYPEVLQNAAFLAKQKIKEAKELSKANDAKFHSLQRLVFLYAALARSRFEEDLAGPLLVFTIATDRYSPEGKCVEFIMTLDVMPDDPKNESVREAIFNNFEQLVEDHPEDLILRWMLAVECREWRRNEQGVAQYKKILEKWKPGPVLVHQTYGNLLLGLRRYDEAIDQFRIAVKQSPAGWSYNGLGLAFTGAKSYPEADEAFRKAIRFDPNDGIYLANWAEALLGAKKIDEAMAKCTQACRLDPKSWCVQYRYALCLKAQGKKAEALSLLQNALQNTPTKEQTDRKEIEDHISTLKKELGR
jgi:tetratricopeptide (TPR) repeat protein